MTRTTIISQSSIEVCRPLPLRNDKSSYVITDFKSTLCAARKGNSPSVNTKSTNYIEWQRVAPILDGRHAPGYNPTVAPPVELYHPVFPRFLANANNIHLEVPVDVVRKPAELMEVTSQLATKEEKRQQSTRRLLANLIDYGMGQSNNYDRTAANHVGIVPRTKRPVELAASVFVEEKTELGWAGDPSVQGPSSYLSFWADPSVGLIFIWLAKL